jgi:hypothetical protein
MPLSPGSKGWINKYFDLLENQSISLSILPPENIDIDVFLHAKIGETGLIFGYPTKLLFAKNQNDKYWTTDEKLKILVFEAHLLVYLANNPQKEFNQSAFTKSLVEFYGNHNASSIKKLMSFFVKPKDLDFLESVIAERIEIKTNLLENNLWINYLNNCFIFLDIILFNEFLKHDLCPNSDNYESLALDALGVITMAAYSDGQIEKQEEYFFKVFLASANLQEIQRDIAEWRFNKGMKFSDLSGLLDKNWLFKHFILDLASFVIAANHEAASEERMFLNQLVVDLNFSENELNRSLALTEQFILNNHDKIPLLKHSSSIEKIYSSFSKRWVKILGRNKDKLATELKQSKELVSLIRKSTTTELSKEEKELVKTQFKDIVKSMPSLAIFMLPGGTVLLPILVKIVPDILPSAFRDNEVETKKDKKNKESEI